MKQKTPAAGIAGDNPRRDRRQDYTPSNANSRRAGTGRR